MAYLNPVYAGSCPDPFVLKYGGEYYCYSTGLAPDGKAFHILHSKNLVDWRSLGGAMDPIPGGAPEYWAPEVNYSNGFFYLYYSVGDGVQMRLRAAVSENPQGPFRDSGRQLSPEDFAIDAHVFVDEDGSRYLFYAVDFLDHTHIGTGTVVDRMMDDLTLEGKPRPVSLPRFDWQVFDPCRIEKGGVRWHTVEGPAVLKYKGRYYQMFSGGNWKNITYGVSYAFADSMSSQQEWSQREHIPLVLSTIPGQVIGPGHNSVVRGPDNRQLYCVYHRWAADESARLLSLDRLEFIGSRLSVLGPSTTPQENPNAPQFPIFRPVSGIWRTQDSGLIHDSMESSAQCETGLTASCFTTELNIAFMPADAPADPLSGYGLRLLAGGAVLFEVAFNPARSVVLIRSDNSDAETISPLPDNFRYSSDHLIRIELNALQLELQLDGRRCWTGRLGREPDRLALFSEKASCSFKGCAITYGFEDNFFGSAHDPGLIGWRVAPKSAGKWLIRNGEMLQIDKDALRSVLVKEHHFIQYELVINARLAQGDDPDSCYGFYPALTETGEGPLIRVEVRENRPHLAWYSQKGDGVWRLPDGFDRYQAQQFRFRKWNGTLQVYREAEPLGSLTVPEEPTTAALYADKARAGFDLVRLTSLEQDQAR